MCEYDSNLSLLGVALVSCGILCWRLFFFVDFVNVVFCKMHPMYVMMAVVVDKATKGKGGSSGGTDR